MIDTDKYEGHTEGEWDLHSMGDGWTIGQLKRIDRTLMQDAPKLLAEVKRLRILSRFLLNTLAWHTDIISDGDTYENWDSRIQGNESFKLPYERGDEK